MAGWTEIESTTLGSAAASVSFTSGLSGYKFFRLTVYLANDANGKTVQLRFNGDSGANYSEQGIAAISTSVSGARATGQTSTAVAVVNANEYGSFGVVIAKPAAGVKAQVITLGGRNASPALSLYGGEWNNTASLISSITILNNSVNFAAGTSILLEGMDF